MVAHNYTSHQEELASPSLEPPAIERLGEMRVPTLVIVGDLDFSDTIAAKDALAQGIPNARQVVFPGVAHMVNMEQPEHFNATVLAFLAGQPPGGRGALLRAVRPTVRPQRGDRGMPRASAAPVTAHRSERMPGQERARRLASD